MLQQQRQQQVGVLGGSSKLSPSHHGGVGGGGGPKLPGADTLLHPGLAGSIADMHQKSFGPYSGQHHPPQSQKNQNVRFTQRRLTKRSSCFRQGLDLESAFQVWTREDPGVLRI